jgi:hypothetical protein
MKWTMGIFLSVILIGLPALSPAQEEGGPPPIPPGAEGYGHFPGPGGDEGPQSPPGQQHIQPAREGRRGGGRGLRAKQFLGELRVLGREIRENKQLIRSLEQEVEAMSPGVARAEVRKKLLEARRHQAELELKLARRRVEITRRARDIAQERYDNARLELERVRRKLAKQYPDLISPEQ